MARIKKNIENVNIDTNETINIIDNKDIENVKYEDINVVKYVVVEKTIKMPMLNEFLKKYNYKIGDCLFREEIENILPSSNFFSFFIQFFDVKSK